MFLRPSSNYVSAPQPLPLPTDKKKAPSVARVRPKGKYSRLKEGFWLHPHHPHTQWRRGDFFPVQSALAKLNISDGRAKGQSKMFQSLFQFPPIMQTGCRGIHQNNLLVAENRQQNCNVISFLIPIFVLFISYFLFLFLFLIRKSVFPI